MVLAQKKVFDREQRYTYADTLDWNWDKGERWELVDGKLLAGAWISPDTMMMSGVSRTHDRIFGELFAQLHAFLKGKPCQLFSGAFEVRLSPQKDNSDDTFFLPDIFVVCDKSKITERGCNGAPDFIIEILSPSTASNDLVLKLNKYLEAGVREYWVVDPENKIINVFIPKNGAREFYTCSYDAEKTTSIAVSALPNCVINLQSVFEAKG
jgi:Uma2 family endonuclease